MRIGAVGDIHIAGDNAAQLRAQLEPVADQADVLLLAGDLTQHGLRAEGRLLARALRGLDLPILAVFGNHDYHQDSQQAIRGDLEAAGVRVLEGEAVIIGIDGHRLGVAGSKGFGGGFMGACGTDFGEPEMKSFIRHTKVIAQRHRECLTSIAECDVRISLTHYSPCKGTLRGERPEIYPFLGSYHLEEVTDEANCTLALHGHAHKGVEQGVTTGGVPVRNVARPVIRCPYKVYMLDGQARSVREADLRIC